MKKLLFFVCCLLLVSCSPRTKAKYMTQFGEFVDEVSQNYRSYDDDVWENKTKKYKKFTEDWYYKFENELTVKDELKIASYRAKWTMYRNLGNMAETINEVLDSEDVKKAQKDVVEYFQDGVEGLESAGEDVRQFGEELLDETKSVLEEVGKGLQ